MAVWPQGHGSQGREAKGGVLQTFSPTVTWAEMG